MSYYIGVAFDFTVAHFGFVCLHSFQRYKLQVMQLYKLSIDFNFNDFHGTCELVEND